MSPTSETYGIFPLGVAMHTHAVERYKVHSRALPCWMLARKVNQRLVLCITVLLSGRAWASPTLAGLHCGSVLTFYKGDVVRWLFMLACLRPYTVNFKWAHSNISRRSISCTCSMLSCYCYAQVQCRWPGSSSTRGNLLLVCASTDHQW